MLVLTRRVGERVKIGNTWMQILEVRGDKIRIGFTAPPEVSIQREENVKPENPEARGCVPRRRAD